MKLKIDTTGVQFLCTRPAQARTERDTGAPRVDRQTGEPLWQVQVAAVDETGAEVLAVTVAGQPDVAVGSPVVVADLVAIPWTQGERSGVAYRAGSIRSGGAPIAGFAAGASKSGPAQPTGRQVP
jgi:hypothetical protein